MIGSFFSAHCANISRQQEGNFFSTLPLVIATWPNVPASKYALNVLQKGGTALDAVEMGVKVVESDPEN